MNSPFLFACGVPRSGTTLLQRMLNHHPELAVANDSHFIPRVLELTDKQLVETAITGSPIPLTPELIANLRSYHRFYRMGISSKELGTCIQNSETYQQLVSRLYEAFARNSNKRLAGEKTPDYVRRLCLLNGLFPEAKLIHLVRDGRDVALSLLHWATPHKGPGRIELWRKQPVAVCALWWRWLVLASREQQSEVHAEVYMEIGYEKLVADPESAMQTVCDFLDLSFSPLMAAYHVGKTQPQIGLSAKSAWLAPQSGLRNWRTDMERCQIELFEALAGDALVEFGYELQTDKFSAPTLEIAAECRIWWEDNFLSRHRAGNFERGPVAGSQTAMAQTTEVESTTPSHS